MRLEYIELYAFFKSLHKHCYEFDKDKLQNNLFENVGIKMVEYDILGCVTTLHWQTNNYLKSILQNDDASRSFISVLDDVNFNLDNIAHRTYRDMLHRLDSLDPENVYRIHNNTIISLDLMKKSNYSNNDIVPRMNDESFKKISEVCHIITKFDPIMDIRIKNKELSLISLKRSIILLFLNNINNDDNIVNNHISEINRLIQYEPAIECISLSMYLNKLNNIDHQHIINCINYMQAIDYNNNNLKKRRLAGKYSELYTIINFIMIHICILKKALKQSNKNLNKQMEELENKIHMKLDYIPVYKIDDFGKIFNPKTQKKPKSNRKLIRYHLLKLEQEIFFIEKYENINIMGHQKYYLKYRSKYSF